jgi:hypothetical protein
MRWELLPLRLEFCVRFWVLQQMLARAKSLDDDVEANLEISLALKLLNYAKYSFRRAK